MALARTHRRSNGAPIFYSVSADAVRRNTATRSSRWWLPLTPAHPIHSAMEAAAAATAAEQQQAQGAGAVPQPAATVKEGTVATPATTAITSGDAAAAGSAAPGAATAAPAAADADPGAGASAAAGATTSAADRQAVLQQQEAALQQLKLCVCGFGKYSDKKQVRKWLDANKVDYANVKKARGQNLAFVGFADAARRAAAAAQLKELSFKAGSAKLEVSEARPRQIRAPQKRQLHYAGGGGDAKRRDGGGGEGEGAARAEPKTIQDQVTPLAGIPYPQQLTNKQAAGALNMVRMIRRIRKKYVQLSKKQNGGRSAGRGGGNNGIEARSPFDLGWVFHGEKAFPVDPIIHAPEALADGYRNKCSFTIGRNAAGITDVGFRMGGFNSAAGSRVVDPAGCKNVSTLDQHCLAVVRNYLTCGADQGGTVLPAFDTVTKAGFWQSLLIRHSDRTGEFMLAFTVCTADLDAAAVKQAEAHLLAHLRERLDTVNVPLPTGETKQFKLASVQMRHHTDAQRASGDYGTFHVLHGRGYIEERLLGLTFRVSAEAFFQVNTPVAELLFTRVGEWVRQGGAGKALPSAQAAAADDSGHSGGGGGDAAAAAAGGGASKAAATAPSGNGENGAERKSRTLLLDICCGTGVIGLTLAKSAKKVVGLELIPEAVEDAKQNAVANAVTNAEFHAGRAEKTLREVLRDNGAGFGAVVGVVDPPRSGLHKDVIKALRKCKKLQHLIYVSCNPSGSFLEDAAALCAPVDRASSNQVKTHGLPFRPVRAVPVDLFPHTDHCEMVVVFSRLQRKPKQQEPAEKQDPPEKQEPAAAAGAAAAGAAAAGAAAAGAASTEQPGAAPVAEAPPAATATAETSSSAGGAVPAAATPGAGE